MYYLIYCNIFTQYIILYNFEYTLMSFNILIIHILGNIFSLHKGKACEFGQGLLNSAGKFISRARVAQA